MSVKSIKPVSGQRTYTSQFKREAVELVKREGLSVAEAARRLGIDQTLLNLGTDSIDQNHALSITDMILGVRGRLRTIAGDLRR